MGLFADVVFALLVIGCVAVYCMYTEPAVPQPVPEPVPVIQPVPKPVVQKPNAPRSVTKSHLGHFKADIGNVYPLIVTEGDYVIRPYVECPPDVKAATSTALLGEWAKLATPEYIATNWCDSDVLYVLTHLDAFVGCAVIDRKQFHPIISHLFVKQEHRKQGHAQRLLATIYEYVRSMGFSYVKLWCLPRL